MSLIDDLMAVVAVIITSNWIQLNRGTTGVINFPGAGGGAGGDGGGAGGDGGGWMWFCYYSS